MNLEDIIDYLELYSSHKTFMVSKDTPSWETVMMEAANMLRSQEDELDSLYREQTFKNFQGD